MRRRGTSHAAAVVLALALVAGCADEMPDGDGTGTELPPTALPPDDPGETATESPPTLPGQPQMVEPQGGLEAVEPHPWDEVFVLNDGRGIELRWTAPPCLLLDRIELEYADDRVTVTLFLGQEDAGEPCEGPDIYRARRRTLPQPVETRSLADGAEL